MQDAARRRLTRKRVALAALVLAGVAAALSVKSLRGLLSPGKVEASTAPAAKSDKKDKDKRKEPASVAVQRVEVGTISAFTSAAANLVAEDEVKIVAEAEGKVVALLAEEGDFVARGQKLVQIDEGDAALAVQKAELALRNAELNLERAERMSQDQLISAQDLDKIRYERDVARQGLAEARHRLRKTAVVAPFAGRVTVRRVQQGQTLKLGDELFTVADFDPLVARIFLPEREVLDLKPGQEVRLTLRAREQTRFRGRVRQVSPVVDTASGTVKVTVEAVAPPPSVRPGAFVTVDLLRETRTSTLLVPRPAIIRELQETYVFVADAGVARKRPVTVGLEEGDRLEITSGVKAGELVVTSGQGSLKDQAPITVAASKS